MRRIGLFIDDFDWHARVLLRAFTALGAKATTTGIACCAFDTQHPAGLRIPGFDTLPDAVFVRALGGGSFEEVTRRLGILHALRERGVPVWNDARAIERCVDKSMTSFLLAAQGIPTPPTWAVEGLDAAREIAMRETPLGPLVLKPLFGSQGTGLQLIHRPQDLPAPETVAGVYLPATLCPSRERRDSRITDCCVCAGAVIAAMTRRAGQWVTNLRRGGEPRPLEPSPDLVDLALRAASCVGARHAGVDLLRLRGRSRTGARSEQHGGLARPARRDFG